MSVCRSCGSNVVNSFCSNCGTPVAPVGTSFCPRCNAPAAPNAAFCSSCGGALSQQYTGPQQPPYGVPPQQPYYQPPQPQPQQKSNIGKYALGALGGAAAVIGGEILMHDVERGIERHVERDVVRDEWMDRPEHRHHHHHHHRRCMCGHEYGMDIDFCPRCRRRWGSW